MKPLFVLWAFLFTVVFAGCGDDDDKRLGDASVHRHIQAQTDCTIVSLMIAADGMKALRGDKAAASYRDTGLERYEALGCENNGRKPYERIEDLIERELDQA